MHLGDLAALHPEKPAVVMPDGRTLTYAELDLGSRQVADLLRSRGVGTRDHIAVLMENCPEFLVVALGAQRAGVYWTPVNWHLTADEAAYVVRDCGARALFASPQVAALAGRIVRENPTVEFAAVAGPPLHGLAPLDELVRQVDPDDGAEEIEGVYFFYSSGTTGAPKGILPGHDFPPFGTGLPIEHTMAARFGFGPDSVYLCPAPLYHAAPAGWSLGTIRNGGTVVLLERFDPADCLAAMERYRVTHAQFVPTHFVRMLKLPAEQRARYDLSSLRSVVHAAAPCPIDVKHAMIDWLGPKLVEFYAGSEGAGMTVATSEDWLAHPGTVGRAAVGTVHIVGDDGAELPAGEIGSIWFSGGGSFEYHNDPEKTAGAHDERGRATLGDLGHLDEDGFLYLADRRTDLIISGGVNVYPAEIENALVMHPAVADVAVIGVPDPEMGQSVRAVVQPEAGTDPTAELAEELVRHCRERLAGFKCPRSIVFTAELPRLPSGKLLRRRVREAFAD
ncbi:acyl-CoA synthetase [Cryptosporangium aurantiacum]|uniref:Acyl-CoA synthetase (AMP-forming)/AMP-acid ligase II n=1 Tax=Cryptosporangium aurantiacum TaxID=134849 RepID=A0A1M7R494_9ACTN|nr:acyl-CoA synthetase [Cryptosporangium aurantiacum]SHN39827.1 Acyl-CoA synthetase (AMP-forming)/AMP-acid ligase II [Cryptosporangium aurantiacum]